MEPVIDIRKLTGPVMDRTGANLGQVRAVLDRDYAEMSRAFFGWTRSRQGALANPPESLIEEIAAKLKTGAATAPAAQSTTAAAQPDPGYTPVSREAIDRALGRKPKAKAEGETASGNASATSTAKPSGDYFALVSRVQGERGCGKVEAMKEVNRRWPEAWGEMLRAANPANARAAEIADRAKGRK